jgi:hypothetical protein
MPVTINGNGAISGLVITTTDLQDGSVTTPKIADGAVATADIANSAVTVAKISATGTPSASTYLRGDGSWSTVSGGVTSITAGTGLTGGTITSSGTIALDYYTGTSATNTSFPIGSYLIASLGSGQLNNAATRTIYAVNSDYYSDNSGAGSAVAGTWRSRGNAGGDAVKFNLMQRTA